MLISTQVLSGSFSRTFSLSFCCPKILKVYREETNFYVTEGVIQNKGVREQGDEKGVWSLQGGGDRELQEMS